MNYDKTYLLSNKEKRIIKEIMLNPNLCAKELAVSLKIKKSSFSNIIAKLKEHNIVYTITSGRNNNYVINENFIKDNPKFLDTMEVANEQKLKAQRKRQAIAEIENLILSEYDKTYILTEKEKEIIKEIITHPDSCTKELFVLLKISASSFSNIIAKLKEHHIVYSVKVGRSINYYVNPHFLKDNPNFLDTMETTYEKELKEKMSPLEYDKTYILTEKEKEIIKEIITHPDSCTKELFVLLKISASSFSNIIAKLKEHHIVYSVKVGRSINYYVNPHFLKDNPNFLDTMETTYEKELKEQKKRQKIEEIENLISSEYDQFYRLTRIEKQIVRAIVAHPYFSAKELSVLLEISASSFSNIIAKLKEHHIVYNVKVGRSVNYYVNKNFLKDNSDFVSKKEEEGLNEPLFLELIKNILFNSSVSHSKLLLNNFEFFLSCFTLTEILQLLYFLKICKFEDSSLIKIGNKDIENKMKRDLLVRYQDACIYISDVLKDKGL